MKSGFLNCVCKHSYCSFNFIHFSLAGYTSIMDEDTGLKSHRHRKENREFRELERKERDREKNLEREKERTRETHRDSRLGIFKDREKDRARERDFDRDHGRDYDRDRY